MDVRGREVVLFGLHVGDKAVLCNDESKEDLLPSLLKEKGVDVLSQSSRDWEAPNLQRGTG